MIYKAVIAYLILVYSGNLMAQSCTITCSGTPPCTINWDDLSCDETSAAPQTGDEIIITNGVTALVNDTYTFDGNVRIENGGILDFDASSDKLNLGSSTGCGRYIAIEEGGRVTATSSSNRLNICGERIGKGGTSGCDDTEPIADGTPPDFCMGGDGINGAVALDENGANNSLLPVDLVNFSGKKKENVIELSWVTSSEIDFEQFNIMHSSNGADFNEIGQLKGKGGIDYTSYYNFTHRNILPGSNYYMLEIVNTDNTIDYSKVINVSNFDDDEVLIYPTFNKLGGGVNIVIPFFIYSTVKVKFLNIQGSEVYSTTLNDFSGGIFEVLPQPLLLPDVYVVEIVTERFSIRKPLVVMY